MSGDWARDPIVRLKPFEGFGLAYAASISVKRLLYVEGTLPLRCSEHLSDPDPYLWLGRGQASRKSRASHDPDRDLLRCVQKEACRARHQD